ncbi:MAG: hypothetical protein ACYDH9_09605 [Limisphaerales bacterium]
MNAFEQIASTFFDAQGYWTRVGLKVDLTKEEKRALGNHSMPRPEIDVVAFKPKANELLIVECKSYLDSHGVCIENFKGDNTVFKNRLKLLTRDDLRRTVTQKLLGQLRADGLLLESDPKVRYGLVAGKIKNGHQDRIREFFADNGWLLVTPSELADGLRRFSTRGYEDDMVTMVVKVLGRNQPESTHRP